MPLAIDSPTVALDELTLGRTKHKTNAETPVVPEQHISSDKGKPAEQHADAADKENICSLLHSSTCSDDAVLMKDSDTTSPPPSSSCSDDAVLMKDSDTTSPPPSSSCSDDAILMKDSDTAQQSDDATLGETFTLSGEANGASEMGDSLFHLPPLAGFSLQEGRNCSMSKEEKEDSSPFEDRRDDFDAPRFLQTRVQYPEECTRLVPETRDNAIVFLSTSSEASWDGNVARETSLFDIDSIGSSCEGGDEYTTDGEGLIHEEPAAIPSSVRPHLRRTRSESSVYPLTSLYTVFLDWVACITGKQWAEINDIEDSNYNQG